MSKQRINKNIFWRQGLFLQPQHFQLGDFYSQKMLSPYMDYIQPHLWGVGEIDIREEGLSNGVVHIDSGKFWFQDGSFAVIHENAVVSPRYFKEFWPEGGSPLKVYIGLKKYDLNRHNASSVSEAESDDATNTRFIISSDQDTVSDLYQKGPEAHIQYLDLQLQIFFESEVPLLGDYELIPIAELVKVSDSIRVSPRFIPPCFTLSGSNVLKEKVADVCDQILARAREMETYKSHKGVHSYEFGARDMAYILALRSLNRYVSLLIHLSESNIHPWQIYGALRQIIGELSTFSERIGALGDEKGGKVLLRRYDHKQLGECFFSAASLISKLLYEITYGPDYIISLSFDDSDYFFDLNPEHFEGYRFYMVMETKLDPDQILKSIEVELKMGALSNLPNLIQYSLPGIKLEHLQIPPQSLPNRDDCLYFAIRHYGEHWETVKNEASLGVAWDLVPDDVKIELMLVRER